MNTQNQKPNNPHAGMPDARDIFAMMALQGILSSGQGWSDEETVRLAYWFADAMLRERSK